MALSDLLEFVEQLDLTVECNLCQKPIVTMAGTFMLGDGILHEDCYYVVSERLAPLTNILCGPQDRFDEWLNEALHLVVNQEGENYA